MGRTCLIFTIQLSPADLQHVKDILTDIQTCQKETEIATMSIIPVNFLRFEGVIQDLTEIVLQSKVNDYKFNAYVLKMAIVKLEFILSEIQLSTTQKSMDVYRTVEKCHKQLLKLFTGIIESI